MSSRDLFELEHGDTGVALLAIHGDRDRSEQPKVKDAGADTRTRQLLGLSRWERSGMLAYIAALHPEVFDEGYAALGFLMPAEP